nr:DUF6147 family protein [uncultured Blautia sp.]
MIKISRWKHRLGTGVAAGILAFVMSVAPVMAEPVSILDEVTATETDADYAEDTSYSILKGNHLNFGTTKIAKLSSSKVSIYGLTQGHHVCDTVYLNLYLERKIDGSYATYKSWRFTANNATSLDKAIEVIVPSGTYYRVRGYHACQDGSKESTSTLTQGVMIK